MTYIQASPRAVYIHIPFCAHKCYYCDFNTYLLKGQPVDEYLQALEREMERTVREVPAQQIETVFVGGGTPTVLLPDQMARFLDIVNTYFPLDHPQLEFTMEANPGTTDKDKLQVMRAGGVNRLSFGVQSFNDELLQRIGRIHLVEDVYRSIELARTSGFTNLSIDLMFGLPGQTMEMMAHSLDAALALQLQHYSLYHLKVEENTLFHVMYLRNELPLPGEDLEADMYAMIIDKMKKTGYAHYEISNFALPGYESKHNCMYWRNRGYYGIGAGAHGYAHGVRHMNVKGVREYIAATHDGLPREDTFSVNATEAMEDFMMVGLRLLDGVDRDDFYEQFSQTMDQEFGDVITELVDKQLLEPTPQGYRLTEKGLMFGNDVFGSFLDR